MKKKEPAIHMYKLSALRKEYILLEIYYYPIWHTLFLADASRSEGTELPGVTRYLRAIADRLGMVALCAAQNEMGSLSHSVLGKLWYSFISLFSASWFLKPLKIDWLCAPIKSEKRSSEVSSSGTCRN